MSHQRILLLDIARSICIILVVIGHFYPDTATPEYKIFRQWIYAFHMPVFFFISGYLYLRFQDNKEQLHLFLNKKFNRLMIPYFITSFIVIVMKLIMQNGGNIDNPVSCFSFIKVFYRPEAGYYLWFIWSLFSIFLVVPWIKTKRGRILLLVISLLLHYSILAVELTDKEAILAVVDIFALKQTAKMLVWFVLGMLCVDFNWNLSLSGHSNKLILILFVLFSFIFCIYPAYDEHSFPAAILPYLGIFSILIVSDYLSRYSSMVQSIFVPLSKASFFIYLFHTTFMGFAKSVLSKISFFQSNSGFYIEASVVVIIGLIVPFIIYRLLIRYTPSIKRFI